MTSLRVAKDSECGEVMPEHERVYVVYLIVGPRASACTIVRARHDASAYIRSECEPAMMQARMRSVVTLERERVYGCRLF